MQDDSERKDLLFFTVFTPTHNRAHTLERVYNSLLSQTFKDFEWLIVDDGSSDKTYQLVNSWQQNEDTPFPIRYIWQKNQHKKVAHNRAVRESKGLLFVVFDSDDYCVSHALQTFHSYWMSIPDKMKHLFVAVCGLCMYENGAIVGDKFPASDFIDSNSLEIIYKYRVSGEKWGAIRTEVLRDNLFREDIPGLVPESTVWRKIAKMYRVRFFNQALRIYSQDEDGLIARKNQLHDASRDAIGVAYDKHQVLSNDISYFLYRPVWFALEAARLSRFYLHTTQDERKLIKFWPAGITGRILVVLCAPIGLAMWCRDRYRMKIIHKGRKA